MELKVRNVNEAFAEIWWKFQVSGVRESSRNGEVIVMSEPVMTTYMHPRERVLWNPQRHANPVFHLMEALWMLTGSNDVEWLSQFNSRMTSYASENTTIMHGAYGHRWRVMFGFDQLRLLMKELMTSTTRRAVLQMWDSRIDLSVDQPDIPCNTHIYFDRRMGALNMTVCCRSNDALWGAYGANVVHFSILQEFLAHAIGVPVGEYRQFSNNFHAYTETAGQFLASPPLAVTEDLYLTGETSPCQLLLPEEKWTDFLRDCEDLVEGGCRARTDFIQHVAMPLRDAYLARKAGEPWTLSGMTHCDWRLAFQRWADRADRKTKDE